METVSSIETSVSVYQTSRCNNPLRQPTRCPSGCSMESVLLSVCHTVDDPNDSRWWEARCVWNEVGCVAPLCGLDNAVGLLAGREGV
jgi:hypothetical protein